MVWIPEGERLAGTNQRGLVGRIAREVTCGL
jgi:hypothetical protein